MDSHITFEELRNELEQLARPLHSDDRSTYWVSPRKLGIAKTCDGALEIFIVGPKLHPRTPTVRRHLEHARWEIAGSGEQLDASRVILPPAQHFAAIAALIAIELIRAGINDGRPLQDVMDDIEPIIELALRRGGLSEDHIIGLIGELLGLEVMLDAVATRPELRMAVLDMWQGHQIGRRDFAIGTTAIEVKTTHQEGSSHKVSGLHQVEPVHSAEERLFLLSVGLAESEHEGQTLPQIVQRVFDRLGDREIHSNGVAPLQKRFLDDVTQYGAGAHNGYDHRLMSQWKLYATRYRSTFTPRLYDLLDQDIRIFRRDNLIGMHVSPDDIQYRIDLQPAINGTNPAPNWRHAIVNMVRECIAA